MVEPQLRKKILSKYYNLKFPGSFQGVSVFQKALKKNLGINISHSALRRILKSSLPYQTNVVKPNKFKTRSLYSRGVYQECWIDPIYIPYSNETIKKVKGKRPKNFVALVAVDVHSRMLYCTKLSSVNPENIKKAFSLLLKRDISDCKM